MILENHATTQISSLQATNLIKWDPRLSVLTAHDSTLNDIDMKFMYASIRERHLSNAPFATKAFEIIEN